MSDFVKIAVKTAIILVIVGAIIGLMATITIPTPDFSVLTNSLSKVLAMVYYWVPGAPVFMPIIFSVLGFVLLEFAFEFGIIASRFIMKVNE